MSFRPHGRARVSRSHPEAWAICDRCGFTYNHIDLFWQFDWQGPRLQNLRILVCRSCMDQPFEHHRTIILPPDPVPIANPRPEFYASDDNPDSIASPNYDPLQIVSYASSGILKGGEIGNMTGGGGLVAAFSGAVAGILLPSSIPQFGTVTPPYVTAPSKLAKQGAFKLPSLNGLNNYIGQNWCAQPGTPNALTVQNPSNNLSSNSYGLKLELEGFTLQAPSDQPFLAGSSGIIVELDGWSGSSWVALWSGTSSGTKGETLSITLTASALGLYYGHRVLLNGDGVSAIAVAHCQFNGLTELSTAAAPAVQPS